MSNNAARIPEFYIMNHGDGKNSYQKNSFLQRYAADAIKVKIYEAIAEKLDLKSLLSSSKAFRIADFGCATGPNTFTAVENIIQSVENKHQSQCPDSEIPEFQVFLNDQLSNDFNTLFSSLPQDRQYFAVGVPGSFHDQLLPESSLHVGYSSYAIHVLPKLPDELVDESSPSWNEGRIHYVNAPAVVVNAYARQFAMGIASFLDGRAKELVAGGMLIMNLLSGSVEIPLSQTRLGIILDLLESTFLDMVEEGIINKAQVDSFNLPIYLTFPEEIMESVERNGSFNIEKLEFTAPTIPQLTTDRTGGTWQYTMGMHYRAGFEGVISHHFGGDIIDELFERFVRKIGDFSHRINATKVTSSLLVVLKRK